MRSRTVALALATALTALGTFAAPASAADRCADPTADRDFGERGAAEANVDPAALQQLVDYATSRNSASVRVYRHGCLLGASRLDPATRDMPWQWFSATKGVTALTVGRALQLGKLSLNDPVSKYFPEADRAHGRIRLHDLITQTGGVRGALSAEFPGPAAIDAVRFYLHQEVLHPPGTHFDYHQQGLTLLLACVQKAVGQDVQTFAQRELFGPLGIERNEWFWPRDRVGWSYGYGGLFSSPRLMPRLAHLMLNEGVWNGRRLLSPEFVRAAQTPTRTNGGYGYLFWTNGGDSYVTSALPGRQVVNRPLLPSAPRDTYLFVGIGGQYMYIVPSLDLVIERIGLHPSRTKDGLGTEGSRGDGEFGWELFRLLDEAVLDASWPDPGPYQELPFQPVEPEGTFEAESTLGAVGIGERSGGCTVLECDGNADMTGYQKMQQDLARYSIHAVSRVPRP